MNNLAYVMAVETLAGIKVPDRARVIRIMLAEFFACPATWCFTAPSPRTWARCHRYLHVRRPRTPVRYYRGHHRRAHAPGLVPHRRCRPGPARGLGSAGARFIDSMPARLDHYQVMAMDNSILKQRTVDIGSYSTREALEWGITGPSLRATGMDFDLAPRPPYGGYDQFEFEVPIGHKGDSYDRAVVRVEEIRQSLRIIRQCLDNMPEGSVQERSPPDHAAAQGTHTLQNSKPWIHHFLNVSWGR